MTKLDSVEVFRGYNRGIADACNAITQQLGGSAVAIALKSVHFDSQHPSIAVIVPVPNEFMANLPA